MKGVEVFVETQKYCWEITITQDRLTVDLQWNELKCTLSERSWSVSWNAIAEGFEA